MLRRSYFAVPLVIGTLSLPACGARSGSVSCGLEAFTKPLAVKQAFAQGYALSVVPENTPSGLAVRLVAGPAWHANVTSDSTGGWRVTTTGTVSPKADIGYGVLVIDFRNASLGVLAFPGRTVAGAPNLGSLAIGDTIVPLLGVRIDPATIQDPTCPVFPDSLR
jgi:hypothetical protein